MWKQTVGDWHERRSHRGVPGPVTPQSNLPESVAATEHNARGFLPPTFKEKAQRAAYPVADARPDIPAPVKQQQQQQAAAARSLTETWVSITGASPDDVLDVRDFLDVAVGRTVSHYLPPPTRARTDTVYVQFASALQAAQAVRAVTFTTRVESGVAAIGIRRDVDDAALVQVPCYYLELLVSWCTDQIFLEERQKLRRQLLESAAPSPLHSQPRAVTESDEAAARSLPSSGRGSEPLATSGAASASQEDNKDDSAAAHPLLPRHRQNGAALPQQSPWSSRAGTTSPSPPPPSPALPHTQARDSAAHTGEDAFYSESTHRAAADHLHDGQQRSTTLSLFFHPCSTPYGVVYTLCLYRPLRLLVILVWTLWNAVRQLLSPPTAAGGKTPRGRRAATPPVPPPLTRWRQRRTLRMADVVTASASPWECLSFLFYAYVPFTPEPEDVDVVLWSWLALHSPNAQRSLALLKQSLSVGSRGRGGDGDSGSAVHQLAGFGSVDVLGGEPLSGFEQQQQQRVARSRELPVLLRWRPAWWFARYSSLSLAVVVALVCYRYWYAMA